jgi:hypothetical protein
MIIDLGPVPFWPLDPGSGRVKNHGPDPGSGSGMNNLDHMFESLKQLLLGLKYLNSLIRIWDPHLRQSVSLPAMKTWTRASANVIGE